MTPRPGRESQIDAADSQLPSLTRRALRYSRNQLLGYFIPKSLTLGTSNLTLGTSDINRRLHMVHRLPSREISAAYDVTMNGTWRRGRCRVHDQDGVRTISLGRGEKHNALDHTLATSLIHEIRNAAADDSIGSVLLVGEGASFCSGDDLSWYDPDRATDDLRPAMDPITSEPMYLTACAEILSTPKLVVAAARGAVLGAGLEIFCAADVRVCDTTLSMGNPILQFEQVGGLAMLGRLSGAGLAEDLYLTGRRLGSDEALARGLVSVVTAPDELMPRAVEFAASRADKSHAVAEFKLLRRAQMAPSFERLLELQGQVHLRLLPDSVHRAAPRAPER